MDHTLETGGPSHSQGHPLESHPKERYLLHVRGGSGEPRFPALRLTVPWGEGGVHPTRWVCLPLLTGRATSDSCSSATLAAVGSSPPSTQLLLVDRKPKLNPLMLPWWLRW